MLVVGGGAATSVDNAGAYREVCVEVRLHHLAVNSLIKSGAMAELEALGYVEPDPPAHPESDHIASLCASGGIDS